MGRDRGRKQEAAADAPRRSIAEQPGLLLFFALALVAVAYSAAPLGGFVWDDLPLIVEERVVRELQPIASYFDRMFFGGPAGAPTRSFYRPLVILSFALDWRLWEGSPLGFHLTNLVIHLGCVSLVFLLARKWGARPLPASLAAALFGVLPRLSEAVAWISGRTDLLAVFFVLGALLIHGRGASRRWSAALLLLLGLLAKEVAVAGLVAIAILELLEWRSARERAGRLALRWLPLMAAALVYLMLRMFAALGTNAPSRAPQLDLPRRALVALEAVGSYGWMWLDPLRPRTQIGSVWVSDWTMVGAGGLVVLASGALIARSVRSRRFNPSMALVALGTIPLLLVLHLLPIALQVAAADRFLYLPAAALAIAAAASISKASPRVARRASFAAALAIPLFAGATYARTLDWRDDVTLWREASRHAPAGNSLPFVQLGVALTRAGLPEEAIPALERSAAIDDELFRQRGIGDGHGSGSREAMALALAAMGRFDEASTIYEALASARSEDPVHRFNLAVVRSMGLDFQGARRELTAVLGRFPDYEVARAYLGRLEGIERRWRVLPAQAPDEPAEVMMGRAEIFAELGRRPDAEAIWRSVAESGAAGDELRRDAWTRLGARGRR